MTNVLLFLILLALVGGGALVGNFLLIVAGVIVAVLAIIKASRVRRKTWMRIAAGAVALVLIAIALNYPRIVNGPCKGELLHDPDTGENFIRLYGSDHPKPVPPELEDYYSRCNR